MTPAYPGYFLSFEGIDGAGKSTHIDSLAKALTRKGREVVLTREPGGTALAEKIRQMVLHDAMDPLAESLLIFAARRDHLLQVILPALQAGKVVLCDRFTDATFAYQGAGRGFNWSVLETLEQWVQSDDQGRLIEPDLTVWFDLAPALAAQRLAGARVPDRFEAQPQQFFEQVASGYQRRLHQSPQRFLRINADQAVGQVWQDLQDALAAKQVL